MSFLGMGPLEILVIVILAFLFFGPERLPGMAAKAGKLYRDLTKATGDLTKTLNKEISLEKEQKENSPAEQSPTISQNAESQIDRKTEESREPVTSVADSDKESNG